MCEAIQQFAKHGFGYLVQTFENEVRTAFRMVAKDAVPPKIGLFVLLHVAYIPKCFSSKNISSQSVSKLL